MLMNLLPILLLLMMTKNKSFHKFIPPMLMMLTLMFLSYTPLHTSISPMIPPLENDIMSTMLISLSLWITSLMITASSKIFRTQNLPNLFLSTTLLLLILLMLTFSSTNMIMFYLFFESSLIPTLLLIMCWGYQPERLKAGMYLMLYTISASLPLLAIIFILFNTNLHMNMFMFLWIAPSSISNMIWWPMFIIALLVKMPMYFLHLWLPKAHVEAPVSGSMILAGILLKLGSYALIRFITLFQLVATKFAPLLIILTLWSASLTSLICLRQSDLKSLIAYSSVAHMALMTAAMLTTTSIGWFGALGMMIAHGLASSALFMLANITYETTNTRSLFLSKGLLTYFPILSMWWFLLTTANMAAPPFLNLMSEIMILSAIISKSMMTSPLIMSASFLTGVYSLHLYISTQHGSSPMFMASMNLYPPLTHTNNLLLFSPLIITMLKMDISISWI